MFSVSSILYFRWILQMSSTLSACLFSIGILMEILRSINNIDDLKEMGVVILISIIFVAINKLMDR